MRSGLHRVTMIEQRSAPPSRRQPVISEHPTVRNDDCVSLAEQGHTLNVFGWKFESKANSCSNCHEVS